jgi:putative two-component system response regulator
MSQLIYLTVNRALLDAFRQVLGDDYRLDVVENPAHLTQHIASGQLDGEQSAALLVDAGAIARFGEQCWADTLALARECSMATLMIGDGDPLVQRLQAVEAGCDDFLCQPFLKPVIDAKLRTHFRLQSLVRHIDAQSDAMAHVMSELAVVQDAAILCLAAIARVRDHSTGNHILRTQHYVKALAEHLRHHPRFAAELDGDTIELLYKTAALHDIGKVAIPDSILQKPERLTEAEFEIMKRHTVYGYRAMHTAEQLMEQRVGVQAARFLRIGQQVTLSHHERWDGLGYPQGLKGEQIPVVARLMSVADVYDAVSSRRPYKDALGHEAATRIITDGRGSHFDPDVVDAFLDLADTFEHIAGVLGDRFPSLTDLTLHSLDDLLPPLAE